MLVAAPAFKTSDYRAMIEEVRPSLPELERVVFLDSPDWDELLAGAGEVSEDELRARADALAPDDPINIQYTSGTTGFPKGATLTHRNILNNGYFVGEGCRYTEEDRICIPVPFYHCFGMVMGNLGRHHPRRRDGHPGAGLRSRGDAEGVRAGALHLAVRRADDVHRPARPSATSPITTSARCAPGSWPARRARWR